MMLKRVEDLKYGEKMPCKCNKCNIFFKIQYESAKRRQKNGKYPGEFCKSCHYKKPKVSTTFECLYCKQRTTKNINSSRNPKFCSKQCYFDFRGKPNECKCDECSKIFKANKGNRIRNAAANGHNFCSRKCANKFRIKTRTVEVSCFDCQKSKRIGRKIAKKFKKYFCNRKCFNSYYAKQKITYKCQICKKKHTQLLSRYNKFKNHFCSAACAAIYRGSHRARRSKLENFIEKELNAGFPNLILLCNDRKIMSGKELDLYFPQLNLAIEFNGPTHYLPIYGEKSLKKTIKTDKFKIKFCKKNDIKLKILDVSKDKDFNEKIGLKYLIQILKLIGKQIKKLLRAEDSSPSAPKH